MFLHKNPPGESEDKSIVSTDATPPTGWNGDDTMDAQSIAECFVLDTLAADAEFMFPDLATVGMNYDALQQFENTPRGEIEGYLRSCHGADGTEADMDAFCAEVEPHVQTILDGNAAYQQYMQERYG